jgi:hypothetical protein
MRVAALVMLAVVQRCHDNSIERGCRNIDVHVREQRHDERNREVRNQRVHRDAESRNREHGYGPFEHDIDGMEAKPGERVDRAARVMHGVKPPEPIEAVFSAVDAVRHEIGANERDKCRRDRPVPQPRVGNEHATRPRGRDRHDGRGQQNCDEPGDVASASPQ